MFLVSIAMIAIFVMNGMTIWQNAQNQKEANEILKIIQAIPRHQTIDSVGQSGIAILNRDTTKKY